MKTFAWDSDREARLLAGVTARHASRVRRHKLARRAGVILGAAALVVLMVMRASATTTTTSSGAPSQLLAADTMGDAGYVHD